MGTALTETEPKAIAARAWRVSFDGSRDGAQGLIALHEPRNVVVALMPIEAQDALEGSTPKEDGSFEIVWMPPGANFPRNVEREADRWIEDAATSQRPHPVRAGIRTVRVFWHDTRALLYANPEQVDDAIDAIVRFTLAEREITWLEAAIAVNWTKIEADASLTHAIGPRDQRRQAHVNEMTQLATRMQLSRLRVERSLEQLDPALAESSKRLYAELSLAASQHDRLDHIDEPIQFALDHYALANTRLIEARNAANDRAQMSVGNTLEVVIILLLLGELIATVLAIRMGG
jgi:hypothetical protein